MKKHLLPLITALVLLITVFTVTFASANSIGDVDNDGTITASDARLALRASVKLETLTAEEEKAADVDGQPGVTASDARLILRASVKLETLIDSHTHEFNGVVTKEATCTENGVKTFTCACGEGTYTEAIPATGHTYDKGVVTVPTCTVGGYTTYTCGKCNHSYKDAVKNALGHTNKKFDAKAPTCTDIGWNAYEACSRCDYTTYSEKAALGHNTVNHAAKAPTCTEVGWDAYVTCSRCDYTTYSEKAALRHNTETHAAKAPTCTEIGWDAYVTCSRCDYTTYSEKAALGHNKENHTAKAPTCTEIGWDAYVTCSRCDYTTYSEKAAFGHNTVAHAAKAPTCTEIGWAAYDTCSRCDYTTYSEIPATGHTLGDYITDNAATCTEAGSKHKECVSCDYKTPEEAIAALGHSTDAAEDKAATCTESGYCSRCQQELPALAHNMISKTVNHTCFEDGYTVDICTFCDYYENLQRSEELKAPGYHTFDEENIITVAPTCTESGYKQKICTASYMLENEDGELVDTPCGVLQKYDIVEPLGHDYLWTTDVEATCTQTGLRTGVCKRDGCGDTVTEVVAMNTHIPSDTPEIVAPGGDVYCKLVIRCTLCDVILQEDPSQGHLFRFSYDEVPEDEICTTDLTGTKYCRKCNYREENVLIAKAEGHDPEVGTRIEPTCTVDGSVTLSKCRVCEKTFENETFIIPAKGHSLSGIVSCTTSVICTTCGETVEEALGHDFSMHAAAYNTDIDQFFCSRCGLTTDDKLATFNNIANKIKSNYFLNTFNKQKPGSPEIIRFSKTSVATQYSRFDFGIYTSAIKNLYEEEMANTPDSYTPVRTTGTLRNMLPLTYSGTVTLLESADIDSIKVEKLNNVNVRDVLSAYADTYKVGNTDYDLTAYKNKVINEDVIKVTVDVKNEAYSQVKNIPVLQKTSLEKVLDLDIRDDANEFKNVDGRLILREEDVGDGYSIVMEMELLEIGSDAKVIYYFAADTYEPILALYSADIKMEQTIDMTFDIGLFSLKGELDPVITTNYSYAYLFPNFFA